MIFFPCGKFNKQELITRIKLHILYHSSDVGSFSEQEESAEHLRLQCDFTADVLCGEEEESAEHLHLQCDFTANLWQ